MSSGPLTISLPARFVAGLSSTCCAEAIGMDLIVIVFLGFFIGLVAAIPIGPVNLLVVRRTLAYDPLHGFMSGIGAVLADAVYASVTGFGFTAIAQLIKGHSTTLQIVGGLMLFFFGAKMYL